MVLIPLSSGYLLCPGTYQGLEVLRYSVHIHNYFVISDSYLSGKVSGITTDTLLTIQGLYLQLL